MRSSSAAPQNYWQISAPVTDDHDPSPLLSPSPASDAEPLSGVVIMVTRPAHQADALIRRVEAAGGQVVCFPTLEIAYLDDFSAFARLAERLDDFDFCVFVSANAVTGWRRLFQPDHHRRLRARLVAVGAGTASAMERTGLPSPLRPRRGSGTEALLALPELSTEAVARRRILIVRGVGGRELLRDTLVARGASVEYLEVYRRTRPAVSSQELLVHRGKVDAIAVTSAEALENLFAIGGLEAKPWLRTMALVTVSERIAELARSIGVKSPPMVANDASDEAIVAALCRWRQIQRQNVEHEQQQA